MRLSPAALETLSIIAYRQPVTRAEVEDVRGVDAGATVKSLLERHLIRIAGQREVPGRPMLYGTTRRFLEVFGLERLKDLPTLREIDELAREQGLLDKAGEGSDVARESSGGVEGVPISGMLDAADAAEVVEAATEVAESIDGVLEAESEERFDQGLVGDQALQDGEAPAGEMIDEETDLSAMGEPVGEDTELIPESSTQAAIQNANPATDNAPTNETEDASTTDAGLEEQITASDEKEEPTSVG